MRDVYFIRFCFWIDLKQFLPHLGKKCICQIWLKLSVLKRPAISQPFFDRFSKFLCLKISTLNFAQLFLYAIFHLEDSFLPKSWYEKWPFFNFYLVTQNTKMTISTKDTDEIFFSAHFLMPLGIPFHKYMVPNLSIFFYFLAPQTHRVPFTIL